MMHTIIRRTVNAWVAWRARISLRRAVPALVALDTREAILRSQHRSGAKAAALERKRLVTERLRMELAR